jgi:predicted DsbA family dithiol-disulfide isomerase
MAVAKKAAKAAKSEEVKKPAAKKTPVPAKKAAPTKKSSVAEKAGKADKEQSTRGPSAAQMFKDLIMEGKLTDDKIFEKVAAQFGLDEKKRGYVKWYRNDLRKKGMNPPEPKG